MKRISLFLMLAVLGFAVLYSSCKKEEENKAPEMTGVSFSLADTIATVTFSEAVYANNDGTGGLDGTDFSLGISSPNAEDVSFWVVHLSGNTTAEFQLFAETSIDGDEIVTIQPADGNSIFDEDGKAMESNQEVSFIME